MGPRTNIYLATTTTMIMLIALLPLNFVVMFICTISMAMISHVGSGVSTIAHSLARLLVAHLLSINSETTFLLSLSHNSTTRRQMIVNNIYNEIDKLNWKIVVIDATRHSENFSLSLFLGRSFIFFLALLRISASMAHIDSESVSGTSIFFGDF